MRKKCKVCGAPLDQEKCDYCGTDHSSGSSMASSDAISSSTATSDFNSLAGNSLDFDQSQDLSQTFNQQPNNNLAQNYNNGPQNYRDTYNYNQQPKRSKAPWIIGIGVSILIVVVAIFLFFFTRRFIPYGTHADSPLLGEWNNGRGSIFLLVFNEPNSVEFLEDGTVNIFEGNRRRTVSWEPGANNTFRADGSRFRFEITANDQLIITDSWNDDWRFDAVVYVPEPTAPEVDEIQDLVELTEENIVGRWNWDSNRRLYYRFYADGTGTRNFSDEIETFQWNLVDGSLHLIFEDIAMWGVAFEMWSTSFDGEVMTLDSMQAENLIFNYIFVGE